jgi:DNA modification methylase
MAIPDWWGTDKPYKICDVMDGLRSMPDGVVQCVVTSPPYWGLRDYGVEGQLGLEKTPEEYVAKMVEVFREVRRVLRDDGTLWLNLGDSYTGSGVNDGRTNAGLNQGNAREGNLGSSRPNTKIEGLKPKDLVGIPWRVAFALQADGWYLRSDIIWAKPNPMPEGVTDRPTKSHEYIFLLSKSARYFYDAEAIAEACVNDNTTRNKRSVWTVATAPRKGSHFATFPLELPELCIKAGTKQGDVVLDPFLGSGTVAEVARLNNRIGLGFELNPKYEPLIIDRSMAEIGNLDSLFAPEAGERD